MSESLLDAHGGQRDRENYYFALAVPKSDPDMVAMMETMRLFAAQSTLAFKRSMDFSSYHTARKSGFSWRILDGDSTTTSPNCPDHWVLNLSSLTAPDAVDRGGHRIVCQSVKAGRYVTVDIRVEHVDLMMGLLLIPTRITIKDAPF